MTAEGIAAGIWSGGALPPNVRAGAGSVLSGDHAFRRFRTRVNPGLSIGSHCTMDGVHFAVGEAGRIEIGNYCYFTNAVLLCELEVRFGDYVVIGWNATIADTDFHPLDPAERVADAIALSPLSAGRARPAIAKRAVVVDDDVWIGPNATILKGVHIGRGAFIEPGALVTRDVPAGARVGGNPAVVLDATEGAR